MPSSNPYHLDIRDVKENVFVTQLNERDQDDNIRRFPVVKESADGLLKSGINTLQKTAMLRQAVAMEEVDKDLAEKRKDFKKRMDICKSKEESLKLKEHQLKDRMQKFDRFLKENELKRKRALQKYQQEVKNNKLRLKELTNLNHELEVFGKRRNVLIKRLEKYKIYENYLTSVTKALPDNYFESVSDSLIHALIQRYEGLEATNEGLIDRNTDMSSDIEASQKLQEELTNERKNRKLLISSEILSLVEEKEHLYERNKLLEQTALSGLNNKRNYMSELGRITMAINNLAEVCRIRGASGLNQLSYVQKMHIIGRFILDKKGVKEMVELMMKNEEFAKTHMLEKSSSFVQKPKEQEPHCHTVNRKMPLPPIAPRQGSSTTIKSTRSGNLLEKLTVISESVAE